MDKTKILEGILTTRLLSGDLADFMTELLQLNITPSEARTMDIFGDPKVGEMVAKVIEAKDDSEAYKTVLADLRDFLAKSQDVTAKKEAAPAPAEAQEEKLADGAKERLEKNAEEAIIKPEDIEVPKSNPPEDFDMRAFFSAMQEKLTEEIGDLKKMVSDMQETLKEHTKDIQVPDLEETDVEQKNFSEDGRKWGIHIMGTDDGRYMKRLSFNSREECQKWIDEKGAEACKYYGFRGLEPKEITENSQNFSAEDSIKVSDEHDIKSACEKLGWTKLGSDSFKNELGNVFTTNWALKAPDSDFVVYTLKCSKLDKDELDPEWPYFGEVKNGSYIDPEDLPARGPKKPVSYTVTRKGVTRNFVKNFSAEDEAESIEETHEDEDKDMGLKERKEFDVLREMIFSLMPEDKKEAWAKKYAEAMGKDVCPECGDSKEEFCDKTFDDEPEHEEEKKDDFKEAMVDLLDALKDLRDELKKEDEPAEESKEEEAHEDEKPAEEHKAEEEPKKDEGLTEEEIKAIEDEGANFSTKPASVDVFSYLYGEN